VGDFEVDTRVEPLGEGRHRAELVSDWEIWGPNGGYLAAIALRALGAEARIPRPASFACHFLSVARFAPVEIQVEVVRAGRRSESLRATMRQEGRAVLEALLRTAAAGPGLEHDVAEAPAVPEPESLPNVAELRPADAPAPYPFWQNLETRVVAPERFAEEPRARDPVWLEWYRFRPRATFDDPFVDAGRLALLVDTLSWPAACQPHPWPTHSFQAPNLDVSVWFHRSEPDCEWLLADHSCPVAEGGLMGTQGRIWSRAGRLLASGGAQLLCVPAPPAS
jgi:acyl-CoA thioesterase II